MRVITGSARGRRLETLPGESTRPTSEKVKESVFSAIQFDIEGRRVLDLFAGSGQLGIEALSRGAAGCTFVDSQADAVQVVRRNVQTVGFSAQSKIVAADSIGFLARPGERFDLAFLDPPYGSDLLLTALEKTALHMNDGGIIVCESDESTELPEKVDRFTLNKTYKYGRICVRLYRYENPALKEETV